MKFMRFPSIFVLALACGLPVFAADADNTPKLTGIVCVNGKKSVLLEIPRPDGRKEIPPPLVVGDVQGNVEVVAINEADGTAKVRFGRGADAREAGLSIGT